MTMPESEPELITSTLWKSAMLVHESTAFPRLVEAAAWRKDKEYTLDMLSHAAADENILNAVQLPANEGMDAVLAELMKNNGEDVDAAILHVVQHYTPPPAG